MTSVNTTTTAGAESTCTANELIEPLSADCYLKPGLVPLARLLGRERLDFGMTCDIPLIALCYNRYIHYTGVRAGRYAQTQR
jgi:hypothetical protein